ncbi:MAG: YkvA family protein [Steroidobacteraceae bacterium]
MRALDELRLELRALALTAHHPCTPWYAKLLVAGVVAYALSPIDLIPDFIPVLGLLDDLVLVPLGIWLASRLIPRDVLAQCRAWARESAQRERAASRVVTVVIVAVWLLGAALCAYWAWRWLFGS